MQRSLRAAPGPSAAAPAPELGEAGFALEVADAPRLHDLMVECQLGFHESLRTWPGNARARQGLRACLIAMVGHEVAEPLQAGRPGAVWFAVNSESRYATPKSTFTWRSGRAWPSSSKPWERIEPALRTMKLVPSKERSWKSSSVVR